MRTSLRNSLSWNKKLSITKFRNSTKIMRVVDSSRPSRLHGSIECHHLVYHTSSSRDMDCSERSLYYSYKARQHAYKPGGDNVFRCSALLDSRSFCFFF